MNLKTVTITGADDSIKPEDLLPLSREFPFVEWGILASAKSTGRVPRFPSWEWLIKLQARSTECPMNLSLHLCGRWVRNLLLGRRDEQLSDATLFRFARVQLNFHTERSECIPDKFNDALQSLGERQFIFQIDGENGNEHMESVSDAADCKNQRIDAVGLFDVSGGAGIVPKEWPKPQYLHHVPGEYGEGVEVFDYHGYAGGLGPENLDREIGRIAKAAGDCPVWIDMETRVRSDDDRLFDLTKVRRCLEIAAPFVQSAAEKVF